jgi:glycosyltransferase involved in cell wall biosynthesis
MVAPKVSVIIPNYNHSKFLRQRMDSVLNQTYRNFEVIILDDCSTDNSKEVIKTYENRPNILPPVHNEKNSGSPFKQWQKGIALATGAWVWVAESDDIADERFLEVMINAIQDQTRVGLAYCDSKIIEGEAVLTETFASRKNKALGTDRWSKNHYAEGLDELENYLLPFGTINNSSAVLFNREILLAANPFDINLTYIGDKYAFTKILAMSNAVYVAESMNYYRASSGLKHADKLIFYFYEQFQVFNWVYRNLKKIDKSKFFKSFYRNTNCSMYRKWNVDKINIFKSLFSINPWLTAKCIVYNLYRPFLELVR